MATASGHYDDDAYADKLVVYNHKGVRDAETVLSRVRFMAKAEKCDIIFLDHVSIMISGDAEGGQ